MICNATPAGWELVYQNAHGRLAADLLRPWHRDGRPPRWDAVVFATAQHDNGWQEWEPGDRRTPRGAPRGFEATTPADVVRQSERALVRTWHASLYAGLLVAEHLRALYADVDDAGVRAMLRAQRRAAARWRRTLGVKQADVDRAYAFLRWADTLSLLLCRRRLPDDARRVEVGPVDGVAYHAWQRPDGSVGLDPWPYGADAHAVSVETHHLAQLTFRTDAALARALTRAPMRVRTWALRPGD